MGEIESQRLRWLRLEVLLQGKEPCQVYAWDGRGRAVGVERAAPADPASDADSRGLELGIWIDWIGCKHCFFGCASQPFSWLTAHAVKSPEITHKACA